MDTLASAWTPIFTVQSALLSLQSLLSTPEPKDPQDAEVATMLLRRPKEFERVAHEWAVTYAGAPKKDTAGGSGTTAQSPQVIEDDDDNVDRYALWSLSSL